MMGAVEFFAWRESPEQVERRRLEAERARIARAEAEAREDALLSALEEFGAGRGRRRG